MDLLRLSRCWLALTFLALTLWCGGCSYSQQEPTPTQPSGQDLVASNLDLAYSGQQLFVSADLVTTLSQAQMQALAQKLGYGAYASVLKYAVTFRRFIYKTIYQGQLIQVSGMLAIPLNTPTPPALLSAQHGTMFRYADAPSNFPSTATGFELVASTGFVTLIPDYIGLGVSSNLRQTFYERHSSARTVVNMIKAAQYYLGQQHIALNPKLFLLGYSEGGYVTMAAQQEIETNPAQGLTLTAAVEGAGGYDLMGELNGVATATTYDTPSYLALFLQAYDTAYGWNLPLTSFFRQPYADRIPGLLDGSKDRSAIDAALTTSPAALLTPAFYAGLTSTKRDSTNAAAFLVKQKVKDNSFLTSNWVPTSPTRLYHGTADETVFYQTSVTTYDRFKAAGATNVTFIPIPGGNHETSIGPVLADALPWLLSFQ